MIINSRWTFITLIPHIHNQDSIRHNLLHFIINNINMVVSGRFRIIFYLKKCKSQGNTTPTEMLLSTKIIAMINQWDNQPSVYLQNVQFWPFSCGNYALVLWRVDTTNCFPDVEQSTCIQHPWLKMFHEFLLSTGTRSLTTRTNTGHLLVTLLIALRWCTLSQ